MLLGTKGIKEDTGFDHSTYHAQGLTLGPSRQVWTSWCKASEFPTWCIRLRRKRPLWRHLELVCRGAGVGRGLPPGILLDPENVNPYSDLGQV